jgi:hypothetical protein
MTKRWNTLRVSAWGFWVGLIYGVVDQFFLSDYEDDFLSKNTVSSIGPIVWLRFAERSCSLLCLQYATQFCEQSSWVASVRGPQATR